MTPYSDIDLGGQCWRQHAITWTNADWSPATFAGIHLMPISKEMLVIFILDMSLKIINYILQPHLQGPNELRPNNDAMRHRRKA